MQALEKITATNSWITALIMLLFISVFLLKGLNGNRLKTSFFEREFGENRSFFNVFEIVIFIFTVVVLSFVIFVIKTDDLALEAIRFSSFLSIFLNLLAYFIVKRTLELLLLHLFLIKKEVRFFIISKANYLYAISFLLYIAIIFHEYAKLKQLYLFYFASFLFLVKFVIHLLSNKNLIFNKLFYFILYICAFEIAPLFILFKLMF